MVQNKLKEVFQPFLHVVTAKEPPMWVIGAVAGTVWI
jgi:hypothetical protein